jgi:hypothetical protein
MSSLRTANRWFSPLKFVFAGLIGVAMLIAGIAIGEVNAVLIGLIWLAAVTVGKFLLAIAGNYYAPAEKRYRHGFYGNLIGTDSAADDHLKPQRDRRESDRDPSE